MTANIRYSRIRTLRALLAGAIAVAPVKAQSVLRLPNKTVEVVGLRRWTIPMIQDSLAKYAPGTTLESHACAAVLRYQLGFADAAAISYQAMPGDSIERVVVIVVEPQDSARVRYRDAPLDTVAPRAAWRPLIRTIAERPGALQTAVWRYRVWQHDPHTAPPDYAARDSSEIREVWRFLAARAGTADRDGALQALRNDRNYRNRMAATAILANFTDQDRVLHALVQALLESDGPVKGIAEAVLMSFAQDRPRSVNWQPVAPDLHVMLSGTSAFQLSAVMRLLVATGAGPELAEPLLRGGGDMLLAFLAAEHPALRTTAHDLLVALRGADLGTDVGPWQDWIHSL